MNTKEENKVRDIYKQLLEGWNNRDAEAMCEPFAEDGELIGYDGSQVSGNTPAQFHGRPHLVQEMTDELRQWMNES
jgi:uncharacterized protein (TIGR02246 family)